METFTCPKGHVINADQLTCVVDLTVADIDKATVFVCEFGGMHSFSLKTAIRKKMFSKEQVGRLREKAEEHRQKCAGIVKRVS